MEKIVKVVSGLYKSYSDYVNTSKMIPNSIDGLLPVQRRILLTLHLIAKNGYVSTAKVLGENMSRFHPHSTADGTAEWAVKNDFAVGDGQWGTSIGTYPLGPAASRYTKMKASSKIEELSFKYVDYVDWEALELDEEPVTIPTMIPFCLMGKDELRSIAFGFKLDCPTYKIKDLISRLEYINGWRKNEPLIYPHINGCDILSSKKDVRDLILNGYGKLQICGNYEIDEHAKVVYVKGWSPRSTFEAVLNKINKNGNMLDNGDIGYIDESTESVGTRIKFEVSKLRNTGSIFEEMKKVIPEALKADISFSIYTVDTENNIKLTSVDTLLKNSYEFYKKAVLRYCKESIIKYEESILELKAIDKIKPHIATLNSKKSTEEAIVELSKKSNVDIDMVKLIISKYRIQKLISTNTDIKDVEANIKELKSNIKEIDEFCQNSYKNL